MGTEFRVRVYAPPPIPPYTPDSRTGIKWVSSLTGFESHDLVGACARGEMTIKLLPPDDRPRFEFLVPAIASAVDMYWNILCTCIGTFCLCSRTPLLILEHVRSMKVTVPEHPRT